MLKDKLYIHGWKIIKSTLLPKEVQTLRMRKCGCSDEMLREMNEFLLARFGLRREFIILQENHAIIANPDNIDWLVENLPKVAK